MYKYYNLIIYNLLALILIIMVFGTLNIVELQGISAKIDKLIELRTPEAIRVLPDVL